MSPPPITPITSNTAGSTYEGTTICLAEVTSTYDPKKAGIFWAQLFLDGHEAPIQVHYCSPFVTRTEGGFIAVPVQGNTILVCKPALSEQFFYLGSTFLAEPTADASPAAFLKEKLETPLGAERPLFLQADPDNSKAAGVSTRSLFKGPYGGGLLISESYNDAKQTFDWRTELNSPCGKKVSLVDSPGVDSIIIDSGNNSKITLTNQHMALVGNPSMLAPGMSKIQVESSGDQLFESVQGTTDLRIKDGKELNIINSSTGNHKPVGPPTQVGPPFWLPPTFPISYPSNAEYGNVNIQSNFKDVNIFTDTAPPVPLKKDNYNAARGHGTGRIFLECLNTEGTQQVIQLRTRGGGAGIANPPAPRLGNLTDYGSGGCVIRIKSSGKVEIEAAGDIEIYGKGNVNMAAKGDLNLSAGGSIRQYAEEGITLQAKWEAGGVPTGSINLNPATDTPILKDEPGLVDGAPVEGVNFINMGDDYPIYGEVGIE